MFLYITKNIEYLFMVKIVAHWEIGYMAPIMESNFWNLPLRDFEVEHWGMVPVSGIRHNETQKVDLNEYETYDEYFEEEGEDLVRVFFEPRTDHHNPNTIWLHDFDHPTDCIYVFGSAHHNPSLFHKRDHDLVVSIKTVQDKGVLWSNQCATLVLYDRMLKGVKESLKKEITDPLEIIKENKKKILE